jgi:hypothetical protein
VYIGGSCPEGFSCPDTWAIVVYFVLVAWGAMYGLANRIDTPNMWRIPESNPKRGALVSMLATILVFVSHPDEPWIVVLVIVLLCCLLYGLSDYLKRKFRNIPAFILFFSMGTTAIGFAAWHAWPSSGDFPPLPSRIVVVLPQSSITPAAAASAAPAPVSASTPQPADWRKLADWQKELLRQTLDQSPGNTLHIIVSDSAPAETLNYAKQFKELFEAHKWKVIGPEKVDTVQLVFDIQLSVSEEFWGKQHTPDEFNWVQSAMHSANLKMRLSFVVDPLVSPKELVMWIGPELPHGSPTYIPLSLGMACRRLLRFTDTAINSSTPGEFFRRVIIKPPMASRFSQGQRLLLILDKPAKSVTFTSQNYQVKALGTAMPRPDLLDISITRDFAINEQLELGIASDEELKARCAVDEQ